MNRIKALAEKGRFQIVELLARHETLTVTQMKEHLKIEQSLVSHRLQVLRQVGLVSCHRDIVGSHYRLNDKEVWFHIQKIMQ